MVSLSAKEELRFYKKRIILIILAILIDYTTIVYKLCYDDETKAVFVSRVLWTDQILETQRFEMPTSMTALQCIITTFGKKRAARLRVCIEYKRRRSVSPQTTVVLQSILHIFAPCDKAETSLAAIGLLVGYE